MAEIKYVTGDATDPQGDGNKIITHICNNKGAWGAGFVVPLGKKFPLAEQSYRRWANNQFAIKTFEIPSNCSPARFALGNIQLVEVKSFDNHVKIYVANMIAQHDIYPTPCNTGHIPPIRYDSVRQCLDKVAEAAHHLNCSVHMPDLIGCGLAGGHRKTVIGLIEETLIAQGIEVVVYTLDGDTSWQ